MYVYLIVFVQLRQKHFYKTSRQFYFYFLFSLSIMIVDDNEIIAVAKEVVFMKPLKDCQIECLRYVMKKQDLMVILPTGYGKILIYQMAPFMLIKPFRLQQYVCLVLTPLNSIMVDQKWYA